MQVLPMEALMYKGRCGVLSRCDCVNCAQSTAHVGGHVALPGGGRDDVKLVGVPDCDTLPCHVPTGTAIPGCSPSSHHLQRECYCHAAAVSFW